MASRESLACERACRQPFFQNTVRRGHHYCMVRVNGKTLEIQAYDLDNRLFDLLKIEKK